MDKASEVLRELEELRNAVRGLTARVYELEQGREPGLSRKAEAAPAPPPPATSSSQALWEPQSAPLPPSGAGVGQPPSPPSPIPPRAAAPIPRAPRPDLESRIGSQWLNRIGIAAGLISVSYGLKYAFDYNWIGPRGRVAIGLLAGIAVVVWSEWFRGRGHKAFSYSLKAVGIGCLYLSLWAAFQVYALVPSGVAFFAMFVVT